MPALTILIACDVLATAMIAGFLTMYCLTIGGYFTFMARTGATKHGTRGGAVRARLGGRTRIAARAASRRRSF